jgi:hypothetical protein
VQGLERRFFLLARNTKWNSDETYSYHCPLPSVKVNKCLMTYSMSSLSRYVAQETIMIVSLV